MLPEEVVCQVVTTVFPNSTVQAYREESSAAWKFRFRLVAGEQVWGLDRTYFDEELAAVPGEVAKQFVRDIREAMEKEMNVERARYERAITQGIYQKAQVRDPWPGEAVEVDEIYEMGSAEPVARIYTSPFTGAPMARTGFTKDGWFDTDQRQRENARLLELARIRQEREEEERAKESILDSIAQRAMRES